MRIRHFFFVLIYYIFRVFPIKKNKVVVSCYDGKGYGDHGKYICNELLTRDADLEIVWLSGNPEDVFPAGVRPVKFRSIRAVYEQVTAKIWIDNKRKKDFVRKRKGQYYIQVWHGGLGIKKVEMDAQDKLTPEYVRWAKYDSKIADLFVAESEWTYEYYKRVFWYDGEIMKCGAPREDILFTQDETVLDRVYSALNLPKDYKLLLYAPTFRNNLSENLSEYDLYWDALLDSMQEKFGGKWMGLIRLHPNVSKLSKNLRFPDRVINVTDYPDMQELLVASACVVTDYSSCLFEFGITKRPGFTYAADYEAYTKERDVMFDCRQLPFPFAQSSEELINNVKNFDEATYQMEMHAFYHDYLRMYEGGNASKAIVDKIIEVIKG